MSEGEVVDFVAFKRAKKAKEDPRCKTCGNFKSVCSPNVSGLCIYREEL